MSLMMIIASALRLACGNWTVEAGSVMTETFAIEAFVVCLGNTSFQEPAITLAHVGFELEEGFQSQGLQDWASTLAQGARGVGSIAAAAAGEVEVTEIEFDD